MSGSCRKTMERRGEQLFHHSHALVRPYLFELTTKPGAEWINLISISSVMQKLVFGSFSDTNSLKCIDYSAFMAW